MSKNETTVYLSAILACFFISTISFAADDSSSSKNNVDCAKEAKEVAKINAGSDTKKYKEEFNKRYDQCRGGGDADSCKTAQKEWGTLKGKFGEACAKAGMGSSGPSGSIACSKEVNDCTSANSVGSSLDEDSTETYDVDQIREKQDKCPAIAGKDLDKIKEELKDIKEEMKDLNEEIPELEQKQVEAANSGQDKVIEIQEAMQTAQQECNSRMKDISRGLKDKEKEIFDQTQQMQTHIIELNNQIGQAENAKRQVGLEFNNAKGAEDLRCHAYAINMVNARRQGIVSQVKDSTYNVGGFNDAVSSAGMPSRKKDQQLAQQYFKNCQSDALTKINLQRAEEKYKSDLSGIDGQITALKAQQAQTQNQIGVMLNNERARANQEAQEDLQETATNCQQQASLNQQKLGQAQMSGQSAAGAIANQLATKKQSLALAQSSYENINATYRLKNSVAGGTSVSGESFFAAMGAGNSLESAAENFRLTCCQSDVKGFAGTCNEVTSFLNSLGKTLTPTSTAPSADVTVDTTKDSTTVTTKDGKEVAAVTTDPKKIKAKAKAVKKEIPKPTARPRCIRAGCKDWKPAPQPAVKGGR